MPFFQDQQPYSYTTPTTTPYQAAMQQQIQKQVNALLQEYQQNYPYRDPKMQMLAEQKLIDDIYNRLGVAGTAGSGAAKSVASRAIVEYRLGLLKEEAEYKQKVRESINQLMTQGQGPPAHVTDVQGKTNPLNQAGATALSTMWGKMMGQQNWSQAPSWWPTNSWSPTASPYAQQPTYSQWGQGYNPFSGGVDVSGMEWGWY